MTQYKVVQIKESKSLQQELEETLNNHSERGWEFVDMERAHRGTSWFFLVVLRKE